MNLSRMHIGFLSVISIFTGIISPVVGTNSSNFPFPLTNLQIPAYCILIFLAVICILLSVRSWNWARFFSIVVLMLVGYLLTQTLLGNVKSLAGISAPNIGWGWVFLIIGSGILLISMYSKNDTSEHISISDHMIGWLSAITILALTGLIIGISYIPKKESSENNILGSIFGTGKNIDNSDIVISPAFPSINNLRFDRKNDLLNFYISSGSKIIEFPSKKVYNQIPYTKIVIQNIEYTINIDGSVLTNSGLTIGKAILPQQIENGLLMESGSNVVSLTNNGIYTYTGVYNEISDIIISKDGNTIVWKSKSGSGGYMIYKNGEIIGNEEIEISNISISNNGKIVMYKITDKEGGLYIKKNGENIEKISKGYIEGSIRMNGIASIYAVENEGNIEIVHNGKILDRKFDEIREIFIEENSDGFVYFGRPLGEKTYCLYTSYRGNLCGLNGYMNPRLSPDGTSIIYAGLKDGLWGIYRNATPIIRNTGYSSREDISQDYAFFDITNPNYYLFIKHTIDGYKLYTKGGWINGIWKDVGLDATFGYDNKIIMSAQDKTGWRIIEL